VEGVHDEADRLERLVSKLLDMTRVAAGALDPRREWVPLEELVGSALRRVARAFAHRSVRTELEPDLPLLPVDPILMEQVLVNLLENVARHTPAGTPVAIYGRARPGAVEVEVADQGPGLPPGKRLFEPFVRGPSGGSGLGLAICRGIVEAHGGVIEADNAAGGASFRFRIPVEGQPPAVPAGEAG
jgi:two-component system sensor histidine kinase KdpD